MLKLLRFETEDGCGPVNLSHAFYRDHIAYQWNELPNPVTDGLNMADFHFCACTSREQLAVWFPPELVAAFFAESPDTELVEYTVPKEYVQVGSMQAIFEKVDAVERVVLAQSCC